MSTVYSLSMFVNLNFSVIRRLLYHFATVKYVFFSVELLKNTVLVFSPLKRDNLIAVFGEIQVLELPDRCDARDSS